MGAPPATQAHTRLRHESHKFEVSLGCNVKVVQKQNKQIVETHELLERRESSRLGAGEMTQLVRAALLENPGLVSAPT